MPSDRVRKEITNYAQFFLEKMLDCVENTKDYAKISAVNKIDNKAFPMYQTTVKRKAL